MALFVGLDVSVKETAVCVVDDTGKVVCEQKVPTEPDALGPDSRLIRTRDGRVRPGPAGSRSGIRRVASECLHRDNFGRWPHCQR
jgi:hypothetical protein